jgi:1-deoxyxylulose-5-phosphate synthase
MGDREAWASGPLILGCGTFGGIGGAVRLIGRGLDEPAAIAVMDEAVAHGITLFDTAESYGAGASEEMIGRWLRAVDAATREGVRIATKVAPPRGVDAGRPFDRPYIELTFAGSLDRLGVSSVELLLSHAPDDGTPIEATLEGLEAVRESGQCRSVGACNVDAAQLTTALEAADRLGYAPYHVVQNGYSLLSPNDELAVRRICAERGIAFTPFSPLAGGALTGKYQRDSSPPPESRLALRPDGVDELLTPAAHDAIDRLGGLAARRFGVECGSLALAWLLGRDDVTAVVIGPSRTAPHLGLGVRALGVDLPRDVAAEIGSWFGADEVN